MGFDNRYEGIDEYAVRIIKHKASYLVRGLRARRFCGSRPAFVGIVYATSSYNGTKALKRSQKHVAVSVASYFSDIDVAATWRVGSDCQPPPRTA